MAKLISDNGVIEILLQRLLISKLQALIINNFYLALYCCLVWPTLVELFSLDSRSKRIYISA